jgi:hypothetical protein
MGRAIREPVGQPGGGSVDLVADSVLDRDELRGGVLEQVADRPVVADGAAQELGRSGLSVGGLNRPRIQGGSDP